MKKLTTLLAGVALAAGAQATLLTVTDSFGLAVTNWTHLLAASQFNPALGTLNSATLSFTDDIQQNLKAENFGASPATITATPGASFLFRQGATNLLTTNLSAPSATFQATAYDGAIDFAGTSGHDFGTFITNGTGTYVPTGAALTALIGTGTLGSLGYGVDAAGTATIVTVGNGNLVNSFSTLARYNLTLVYDYTPRAITVPEPGSMALFGVALAGLGFMRRKASKAA